MAAVTLIKMETMQRDNKAIRRGPSHLLLLILNCSHVLLQKKKSFQLGFFFKRKWLHFLHEISWLFRGSSLEVFSKQFALLLLVLLYLLLVLLLKFFNKLKYSPLHILGIFWEMIEKFSVLSLLELYLSMYNITYSRWWGTTRQHSMPSI